MLSDQLEEIGFWTLAIVVVLAASVGVREWSRARQFRENLKANGRRK
jgi:hypothetical protein